MQHSSSLPLQRGSLTMQQPSSFAMQQPKIRNYLTRNDSEIKTQSVSLNGENGPVEELVGVLIQLQETKNKGVNQETGIKKKII